MSGTAIIAALAQARVRAIMLALRDMVFPLH